MSASPKLIDVVVALLCRNRVDEALKHLIDFAVLFSDREDFLDMTLEEMKNEVESRARKVEDLPLSNKENFWYGEAAFGRRT